MSLSRMMFITASPEVTSNLENTGFFAAAGNSPEMASTLSFTS